MDMDLDADAGGFPTVDETAPDGFPAVDLDQLFTAARRVPRGRAARRPDPAAAGAASRDGDGDGGDEDGDGDGAGVSAATAHLDGLVHFSSDEEEGADATGGRGWKAGAARKKAAAAATAVGGAPPPHPGGGQTPPRGLL